MNNRKRSTIWLHFVGIVFGTILLVFFSITLIWFLLFELDIIESSPQGRKAPLLLFLFGSVLLGGIISLYVGRVIIRPVQNIGKAFQELSGGNFSVKVSENEKIAEIREIARQFNAMTYDLLTLRRCGRILSLMCRTRSKRRYRRSRDMPRFCRIRIFRRKSVRIMLKKYLIIRADYRA